MTTHGLPLPSCALRLAPVRELPVPRLMLRLWALCSLLILLCLPAQLRAANEPAPAYHITPQLIAEHARVAPGGTTMLALTMAPRPGWHGYWLNGGAAGFALQDVRWSAPPGIMIGDAMFPVPTAKTLFGMMNHVYEAPYAILFPVRISSDIAPQTPVSVQLSLRWLACSDQVCVPEEGRFTAYLSVAARSSAARTAFDDYRQALPRPLDQAGSIGRAGNRILFAIALPADVALDQPHLFVAERDLIDPNAPQRFLRSGDRLFVETLAAPTLAPGPMPAASAVLRLSGSSGGLALQFTPGSVAVPHDAAIIAGDPAMAGGAGGGGKALGLMLLGSLLGAVIGGMLLNLMPCVFPILSLKALSLARLAGEGQQEAQAARRDGWAYLAGSTLMALGLGGMLLGLRAAGEEVGWAFQLQNAWSIGLLILLFAAITAGLLGWVRLPVIGIGQGYASQPGAAGSFWTGALAAFVAAPCSGPFLGAALGATLLLPWWGALAIFAGLGLGLAAPFTAIAHSEGLRRRLPRPGPWMVRLQRWLAIPMALTLAGLIWLFVQHYTGSEAGTLAGDRAGDRYSEAALTSARASGKPVLVNYTADWCISCRVNEQTSIDNAAVQEAFARSGVVVLTADWTRGDPAITQSLARHGRNSVPLYLWYAPGARQPDILPQILTPDMLTSRAEAAR